MKICIATNLRPFRPDQSAHVAEALSAALRGAGHEVEHVRLPLDDASADALDRSCHAAALMRFDGYELVVALGFPVGLVQADRLLVWMVDVPMDVRSARHAARAWDALLLRQRVWLASAQQASDDSPLAPVVQPRPASDAVWWRTLVREVVREVVR